MEVMIIVVQNLPQSVDMKIKLINKNKTPVI